MVVKKTATPTMSSRAAIGIRVLVTAPFVRNSFTMESAGAGAVASAIPPKMNGNLIPGPPDQFTVNEGKRMRSKYDSRNQPAQNRR